jgi:DNA-binding transcriptional ArsR family regulator
MPRAPIASPTVDLHTAEVSEGFERECVDFFADVVGVLGVPRSMGQIYGLLFASPRPLSFTDITEKLDISRGSASQGLKALRELGAIYAIGVRGRAEMEDGRSEMAADSISNAELRTPNSGRDGNRGDLYVPELGLRRLVGGVLREKVEPIVQDGAARLKKLRTEAQAAPDAAGRKFSEARVKQIESWRRQMGLLLPLLKTILGPKRG